MRKPVPTATEKPADSLALAIGNEIGRALEVKKMTVTKLHQETGISRTVLQGYLKGRYKPGARELKLLSQALDCSPNRLLFGREDIRESGYLDELVGNAEKTLNASQLAIIFAVLTREEQHAAMTLLALMAERHVGGRDNLAQALKAAGLVMAVLEAQGPALEERMGRLIGPAELKAIEAEISAAIPPPPPPKSPTTRKKPGK